MQLNVLQDELQVMVNQVLEVLIQHQQDDQVVLFLDLIQLFVYVYIQILHCLIQQNHHMQLEVIQHQVHVLDNDNVIHQVELNKLQQVQHQIILNMIVIHYLLSMDQQLKPNKIKLR